MSTKKPTFEQALNAAMHWCGSWDKGELSDEVLADRVSELLESLNGARGFFAISLTIDSPLMDRLPEALVVQLRSAGAIVVDLIVRNLAMSTAMTIHHQRQKDEAQKAGSERVKARCLDLLKVLEPNKVKSRLEQLLRGLQGEGPDVDFLKKWNYDNEQKLAISSSIYAVAEKAN